jgi:hypothetical protein
MQIKPMVSVFRAGVASVLNVDWLRMFDHRELQRLISGDESEIDVDDMRRWTLVRACVKLRTSGLISGGL